MNKKHLRLLSLPAALAAAALVLAGCAGSSDPEPSEPAASVDPAPAEDTVFDLLPQNIQDAGVLLIGVSPNFAPGNFEEDDGTLNGSEIQFAQALAPYLGVDTEHVITNFAGLLTGLQANRFDVVLSGMSDTLEREQQVTFVNYMEVGADFLVPAGNPNGINGIADLCGLTGGAPQGTSYIDELERISAAECAGKDPIEVQTFPSGTEVVTALSAGRIDFSLASSMANAYNAQLSNGALEAVGEPINQQYTGFVVPKDNEALIEALAAAVQMMIDNGELAEILSEWGLESQLLDEVKINGATF